MLESLTPVFILLLIHAVACGNQHENGRSINDVTRYWQSLQNSKAVVEDAKFPRLVGFIEGALDVNLPDWWISEGLTRYAPPEPSRPSPVYGSHPQHELKIEDSTYLVKWHSSSNALSITTRGKNDKLIWDKRIGVGDLHPGLGIGGMLSVDCALVKSQSNLFLIGRSGIVRFIYEISSENGEIVGSMSFIEDGSYLHISQRQRTIVHDK